jgi:hypothetical protein
MGEFFLFFAGLLLSMLTGVFGNWAVSSWYYHKEHPELDQINKWIPIAGFSTIFFMALVVFHIIATKAPNI